MPTILTSVLLVATIPQFHWADAQEVAATCRSGGCKGDPWTEEHRRFWEANNYVVVPGLLTADEVAELQVEVDRFEETADPCKKTDWMNWFEFNNGKKRVFRTEKYAELPVFAKYLRGKLERLASFLMRTPAILFKERVNYKRPGGGGFPAHQDGLAWEGLADNTSAVPIQDRKWERQPKSEYLNLLTNVMVSIDQSGLENGGLEVASDLGPPFHANGSYVRLPQREDGCMNSKFEKSVNWVPIVLKPGDSMMFGVSAAHRSGPNHSPNSRRVMHVTYNAKALGDFRDKYYHLYNQAYPPEAKRTPGVDYTPGANSYFYCSPNYHQADFNVTEDCPSESQSTSLTI